MKVKKTRINGKDLVTRTLSKRRTIIVSFWICLSCLVGWSSVCSCSHTGRRKRGSLLAARNISALCVSEYGAAAGTHADKGNPLDSGNMRATGSAPATFKNASQGSEFHVSGNEENKPVVQRDHRFQPNGGHIDSIQDSFLRHRAGPICVSSLWD